MIFPRRRGGYCIRINLSRLVSRGGRNEAGGQCLRPRLVGLSRLQAGTETLLYGHIGKSPLQFAAHRCFSCSGMVDCLKLMRMEGYCSRVQLDTPLTHEV
jgi:hypothetical protein